MLNHKMNLKEILDLGLEGKLDSLTKEDWRLIEYLINQNGRLNFEQGKREGLKAYRGNEGEVKDETN